MRDYIRSDHRSSHSRLIAACCGFVVVLIACTGCHSGSPELSKADEAQMRANFAKKGPVNVNDLPADQKAKIQEFFQKGGAAGSAPGAQQGSAAPSTPDATGH